MKKEKKKKIWKYCVVYFIFRSSTNLEYENKFRNEQEPPFLRSRKAHIAFTSCNNCKTKYKNKSEVPA